MFKKGLAVLLLVFVSLSFAGMVSAANSTSSDSSVDKAYSCLKNQIDKKSSMTLQEAVFSALALGSYGNITQVISNQKASQNCWPKSGCTIKETSQVFLAYERMGIGTSDIESWILARNSTSPDLAWYLEIDAENHSSTSCTVKYSGGQASIQIADDMKLSGSPGACFSISSSGYLLKVRESCLDKTFDISCTNGFVSALLYQKNRGENVDCLDQGNVTCYVLGDTHSAPSLGTTQEKITSSCFKSSSQCDYEGSLWATLALQKAGKNIDSFIPYLLALEDDYQRYFSYSFLSAILGSSDDASFSNVIQLRKQNQYWEIASSPYNRFYDTSLGMLALSSGSSQDELQKTKDYLLNIQTPEGCWNNNNVRDTAFILYSGWVKSVSQASGASGGSAGGTSACTDAGFSCEKMSDCTSAGGILKQGFLCGGVSICCSVQVPRQTCESQNGKICPSQTECDGSVFEASNTQGCCLGTCVPIQAVSVCESAGGFCASSCQSGEEETIDSCSSSSQVCCIASQGSGSGIWWIILLAIFIILIILAIIFRHRIQMWRFSRKSGVSSSPVSRPRSPPSSPAPYRPMPQRPIQRQIMSSPRPVPSQTSIQQKAKPLNKDYEDTLKKLKEMSK